MPTWGWLVTAMVGALIVWAIPRIASFTMHAYADQIVDRLIERIRPEWMTDLDDVLNEALSPIRSELTLNGGGSTKDLVLEIRQQNADMQRQLEALITDR